MGARGNKMFSDVMKKSTTCEWETPQWLFDEYNKKYKFTLDVCSTKENAKCKKYFTKEQNGLIQSWENERCWMNPPYGREISKWMKKAWKESKKGTLVVCLIPSRTDTKWWHEYAQRGDVKFIRGRLKFGNSKNSAPFPSAIVVFGGKNEPSKAE